MTKVYKIIIPILLFSYSINFAQMNVDLVGQLNPSHGSSYSDIWGYTDSSGIEYAIIGSVSNTFIINLANPSQPVVSAAIEGPGSIWRDIKVHDHYAYVTTEGGGLGEGLQIIDLSGLPDTAVLVNTLTQYFTSAHNIFIDNGFAYVVGTGGGGGIHILDLADPVNPVETSYYTQSGYVHDLYVWNDTIVACAANSYDLVDVTNKQNPQLISVSPVIPGIYAHSGWMSEDKRYFFGTDEFNVTDLTVWDLQDRTTWNLVVPSWQMPDNARIHNLFIKGNYAHISYYEDGYVVLDISNPESPFLVGQYDTYSGSGAGFNGAWGCYPFLPSGLTLISDIETGLYVLRFDSADIPPIINSQFDSMYVFSTDSVRLTAEIFDDNQLNDVKFYYRSIINSIVGDWVMVSDTQGPVGNEYTFTIPGQEHLTKIEYYFAAIDNQNQVTTLPAGGSGQNPPGNIPPTDLFSYQVIIAGIPVVNSFSPAFSDTTVAKGTSITFSADIEDTTNLPITKTWFKNSGNGVVRENFTLSTSLGPVPRTDTIRLAASNGFNSVERIWTVNVVVITSVEENDLNLSYKLAQNYPNPFNPTTSISYSVTENGLVNLDVYNLLGEKVAVLVNEVKSPGKYRTTFDAGDLSAGIYIASIKAQNFVKSIKMILLK